MDREYARVSDRACELADLVEHPEARSTAEGGWAALVDRFALDADEQRRFRAARGLLAMFWLTRLPGADARWEALTERAVDLIEGGTRSGGPAQPEDECVAGAMTRRALSPMRST